MSIARSLFYNPEFFEDGPSAFDLAADRNQRIADRKAELITETLKGVGDFWPPVGVRCDGATLPPEWDLEQGNVLLAALRDSFLAAADPAGAQLRYAKAISDTIEDYAQRRAQEEVD